MKRTALIGTLIVSLAAGSAALADGRGRDYDRDRDHDRDRGRSHYYDQRHDYYDQRYDYRNDHRSYSYDRRYDDRRVVVPRYGTYYRPHGYYDHRWIRGERLPRAYYEPRYVVDYRDYGLRIPPRGYHWVRVNGDAVLVGIATGIVLDSIFHAFD